METILIKIKSKNEASFVVELLKKLGIKTHSLQEDELEELGLIKLMKEADRTQKISREEIVAKLSSK